MEMWKRRRCASSSSQLCKSCGQTSLTTTFTQLPLRYHSSTARRQVFKNHLGRTNTMKIRFQYNNWGNTTRLKILDEKGRSLGYWQFAEFQSNRYVWKYRFLDRFFLRFSKTLPALIDPEYCGNEEVAARVLKALGRKALWRGRLEFNSLCIAVTPLEKNKTFIEI